MSILHAFGQSAPFPVHVVQNERSLGYGENFMQTSERCSGEWIAFCDQDDFWRRDKIALCSKRIRSAPADCHLLVHGTILGDEQLRDIGRIRTPAPGFYSRLSLVPDWFTQGFRMVFHRGLIDRHPISRRSMQWHDFPEAHDTWVSLLAAMTGSILVIDDQLVIYRRHSSNATLAPDVEAPSRCDAMLAARRGNSDAYVFQGEMFKQISLFLKEQSSLARDALGRELLMDASIKVGSLAERLIRRARAQSGPATERVTAFAQLVRQRAYSRKTPWSFGARGLIKDMAFSLAGPLLNR